MSLRISIAATAAIAVVLLAPAPALGAADISVSLTATPSSLPLGGPGQSEFALSVKNEGADPASGVSGKLNTGAPELAFFGFVSISQGSASAAGGEISFAFGEIAAGATATLKWTEDDAQSGKASLVVAATTSTAESSVANNTATATVDVLALTTSATSLLFDSELVGGIGTSRTLTATNEAAVPVQISRVALSGDDFVLSSDGCAGISLAVGASCQISARFAPAAIGSRSGDLTLESATAKVSPVHIALTGSGATAEEPPAPDTSPPSLHLAGVPTAINAKRFRKGFTIVVTPDESAALDVELLGKALPGALASALDLRLFSRSLADSAIPRKVKVKPKSRLVGKIRHKLKVKLEVVATDAAGNRSTRSRSIVVKPAG